MPTATRVYNLALVMSKAWASARAGARRFGGTPRLYLASAMKQAWQAEKAAVARLVEQEERIRAAAFDLIAVELAAAARREEDRRQFKLALAEELARPRVRPPVMTEETRAFLARLGAAQQREAAAKAQAATGRAA